MDSKVALLFDRVDSNKVQCNLCAHRCVIADGKRGVCGVRENRDGMLFTLVYGHIVSQHIDPVEKKPLFHFYPGSTVYSIAAPGCNFRCQWCQNWGISQYPRDQLPVTGLTATPQRVVTTALRVDSRSIAYTYTEPTVFFEFAYDTSRLAHAIGMRNVCVTNGYMTAEMLKLFKPYLDAANVDLKTFRDESYRHYTGARLEPVLDTLKEIRSLGIWLEVTTLVIPGVNDDPAELRDVARFVAQELGTDTPWHISRFLPANNMDAAPATPVATLRRTWELGRKEGLKYVYVGNVPDNDYQNTVCPGCRRVLIRRNGWAVLSNRVQNGRCTDCGAPIAGIGMSR